MKQFELPNIGDNRKSFYGKAQIIQYDNGTQELKSYDTIVATLKNGKATINSTYSTTTLRHIKSWLIFNGLPCGSKSEIVKNYMN